MLKFYAITTVFPNIECDTQGHPYAYANKGESTLTGCPSSFDLKHDRERTEHEVQRSVFPTPSSAPSLVREGGGLTDDGSVDGEEHDDEFPEEKHERTRKVHLELIREGLVRSNGEIKLRDVYPTRLECELSRQSTQQNRRIWSKLIGLPSSRGRDLHVSGTQTHWMMYITPAKMDMVQKIQRQVTDWPM